MEPCRSCGQPIVAGSLACGVCGTATPEWDRRWGLVWDVAGRIVAAAEARHESIGPAMIDPIQSTVCRGASGGVTTKIHMTMFVGPVPPGWASTDVLTRFADAALQHAIDTKSGLPRGMQSGVAAIAVAVCDSVPPDLVAWASKRTTRFAAIGVPVLVDASTGRVHSPPGQVVGAVYNRLFRRTVDERVTAAFGGSAA